MWHLLFNILLVSLGAVFGFVLMCLISAGKEADKNMEKMDGRNEE